MDNNDIQFDTDKQNIGTTSSYVSRSVFGKPEVPGMAAWLMKKGIIKDESQAKNVLLGIVLLDFIVAGAVLYFFVFK